MRFLYVALTVCLVCPSVVCPSGKVWADDGAKPAPQRIERGDGSVLHFYRPKFVSTIDLQKSLGRIARIDGVGSHVLPQQGLLILDGAKDAVDMALIALAAFDRAPLQVFVEAKVMLVNRTKAEGTVLRPPPSDAKPDKRPDVIVLGENADPDHVVAALKATGAVETLARASVVATQGIKAEVTQVLETSVLSTFEVRDDQAVHRTSPVRTGLRLSVMPLHIGDGFVTMEVEPDVKGFLEATAFSPTLMPSATSQSAKTTVTLKTGQAVVIGRLTIQRESEHQAQPPVVVNRPLHGTGGRRPNSGAEEADVVIVITARIIATPDQHATPEK